MFEARIGTVMDVCGDYAVIKYDETGAQSQVAMALLPEGLNPGDRIKFENFEYEKI